MERMKYTYFPPAVASAKSQILWWGDWSLGSTCEVQFTPTPRWRDWCFSSKLPIIKNCQGGEKEAVVHQWKSVLSLEVWLSFSWTWPCRFHGSFSQNRKERSELDWAICLCPPTPIHTHNLYCNCLVEWATQLSVLCPTVTIIVKSLLF